MIMREERIGRRGYKLSVVIGGMAAAVMMAYLVGWRRLATDGKLRDSVILCKYYAVDWQGFEANRGVPGTVVFALFWLYKIANQYKSLCFYSFSSAPNYGKSKSAYL